MWKHLILFISIIPTLIHAETVWKEAAHIHHPHSIPLVPSTSNSASKYKFYNDISLSITFKHDYDTLYYFIVLCAPTLEEVSAAKGISSTYVVNNKVNVDSGSMSYTTFYSGANELVTFSYQGGALESIYSRYYLAGGFEGESGEFFCTIRPTGNLWPKYVYEQDYIRVTFNNASSWAVPSISASTPFDLGRCSQGQTLQKDLPIQISYRGVHDGLTGTLKAQLLNGEPTLAVINPEGIDLLKYEAVIPQTLEGYYYRLSVSSRCPDSIGQHEWQLLLTYSIE